MSSDSLENAIRELAYAKWEQSGCPCDDGVYFWLEAEKECVAIQAEISEPENQPVKPPILSSFRAIDPPPLKLNKASSQSRKKAG